MVKSSLWIGIISNWIISSVDWRGIDKWIDSSESTWTFSLSEDIKNISFLEQLLNKVKIRHKVLNAKHHDKEAASDLENIFCGSSYNQACTI